MSREFKRGGVLRVGVVLEELALLLLAGKKREDQPGGMVMVALGGVEFSGW